MTRLETWRRINFVLTRLLRRGARNCRAAFLTPLAHLCFGRFGLLRIQSGIASEIEGLRGKGESRPALIHDVHDLQEHLFANAKKFQPFRCFHIGEQFNIQRRGAETDKPDTGRIGLNPRMIHEYLPNLDQQIAQLLRTGLIAKADDGPDQHSVALGQIHQRHLREHAVRHGREGAIPSPNPRRANADGLDRSLLTAVAADVANPNGFIREQTQTANQIFHGRLSGQSNGQTADTQTCEDPIYRQAQALGTYGQQCSCGNDSQ